MTRRGTHLLCVATAIVLGGFLAYGQTADRAAALNAELDRIFKDNKYAGPRPPQGRWLPDGSGYAVIERSAETRDGVDIVRYDAEGGTRSVVMPASRLIPPGTSTPLGIDDYEWSSDGSRLLIFTNTARVWRLNTRGDYWVLDIATGRLRKLGGDGPASSLMFAKFSPDGTRAAYVRANDIYVERLSDGRIARLTRDGSTTTINGTSDWVYEEELGIRDGFRWSPDGRHIAYWQFDSTRVGGFSLINTTDTLYPVVTTIPYPKVGTTNSAARIGVVSASGGRTRWLQTPGAPRESYLASLDWVDTGTVMVQQLNRLQNRTDFLLGDARSGKVRALAHDESTTWVDVADVQWVDHGRAFLILSERDGWRHAYRVSRADGATTLLTRFDADVVDIAGIDEQAGWLYFRASPTSAPERFLYRSRLDGTGVPERITPADRPGTHAYAVAPGGRLAFHTWSRADQPPVTDIVALDGHRSLRALTDTSAQMKALEPLLSTPMEFFTVEAAGVTMDGWMLRPPALDPSRRYPVIFFVYGEPAGQTVVDGWGGSLMLFHRALAAAGYVVVSIDNRGTPAPKGAAWRHVVYGSVGDLSSKEQAAAVGALVKRHSFLDPERVGIWGWSGGATNTLNALFRFPDVYQVGVAVAPVPDQRLYDTIYQERYMGLPSQNETGYRAGSAIHYAEGLRGHLLLIHGSGDDNVHMQGTERLINRLVELHKPFDLMIYPNRTHAIAEGPGTSVHVFKRIARHFLEHLPAEPR